MLQHDKSLADGNLNRERDLIQFSNPSRSKPQIGDLIIMDATSFNGYGHVAVISEVLDNEVQLIQQNPGATANSRIWFDLNQKNGKYYIEKERILGWLRIK